MWLLYMLKLTQYSIMHRVYNALSGSVILELFVIIRRFVIPFLSIRVKHKNYMKNSQKKVLSNNHYDNDGPCQ